jgi:glucosylglycerate phosphorylase
MTDSNAILDHLSALYGGELGRAVYARLRELTDRYRPRIPRPERSGLDERDAILITYGDQLLDDGKAPLQTLAEICQRYLSGVVSGIHVLPFYPSSSDDGFSVIDYRTVDPALGGWDDVARLRQRFRLMFDAVVNHVSARSQWFQRFLQDDPRYRDFFVTLPEGADLSTVVRPRTLPLVTRFATPSGEKGVWTTFSADQIDLDYRNPEVLVEIVETLLFYVTRGAELIRLDAIAYLWKEPGTSCIHLPQTHRVIQLLRAVLDQVAPQVMLVTETNVPHLENLSYFGDGTNEAQLVYNFALPPLVLHTLQTGDAGILSRWASSLALPSRRTTFFNFLASHDGIGVNPARGILSDGQIDALVAKVQAHGGLVSQKSNPDGTTSPYELNVNYFDALSDPAGAEPIDLQVDRFVAAQAVMLSLVGVPGIYFHSLFGSRGWREGVTASGRYRTINRQKLELERFEAELADQGSVRSRVFDRLERMLRARAAHPAFHPHGAMRVLDLGRSVFGVLRTAPQGEGAVICLLNVTDRAQAVSLAGRERARLDDLLSNQRCDQGRVDLRPYQVRWLASRVG